MPVYDTFILGSEYLTSSNMDGNPMDGTLGYPSGYTPQGQPPGGWQGMSIKDILEKVDLFNFTSLGDEENGKRKDRTNEAPMIPDLKV